MTAEIIKYKLIIQMKSYSSLAAEGDNVTIIDESSPKYLWIRQIVGILGILGVMFCGYRFVEYALTTTIAPVTAPSLDNDLSYVFAYSWSPGIH